MGPSLHSVMVPVFEQMLSNLATILDKAERHCADQKIEPAVLLGYRLAPNMLPLSRQIQLMTDMAKSGMARLAGLEPPRWPDDETTFPELQARLATALDYLSTAEPERFEGAAEREIRLKAGTRELSFTGIDFLTSYILPNFYFHATTAYAILRHAGVPLSKSDFLGMA